VDKHRKNCLFEVWRIVDDFGREASSMVYPQIFPLLLDEKITI